jgi:hypothetical protein
MLSVFVRVTLGVRSRLLTRIADWRRRSSAILGQAVRHETQCETNRVASPVFPATLYLLGVVSVQVVTESVAGRFEYQKVVAFCQFSYHAKAFGFHQLGMFGGAPFNVDTAPIELNAIIKALGFWHKRAFAMQRDDVEEVVELRAQVNSDGVEIHLPAHCGKSVVVEFGQEMHQQSASDEVLLHDGEAMAKDGRAVKRGSPGKVSWQGFAIVGQVLDVFNVRELNDSTLWNAHGVVLPVFARERLELFAVRLFVADGLNTLAFLSSTMWIVRAGALEGFLGRDDGLTQGRTRGGLLVRVDRSSNGRHIGGVVCITAAGSRITTAVVVRLLIGIHESTLTIAVQSTCKRSFLYLRRSSCRCLTAGDEKNPEGLCPFRCDLR